MREGAGKGPFAEQEFGKQPRDHRAIVSEHAATSSAEHDRRLIERHGGGQHYFDPPTKRRLDARSGAWIASV